MTSVAKAPITDFVELRAEPCLRCNRYIEARWIPQDDDIEASWALNHDVFSHQIFVAHCHECLVGFAPGSFAESLARLYGYIHAVLHSTHLLVHNPSGALVGPDAFRHPPRCPTLTMVRWQPAQKTGSTFPYVEEFSILGEFLASWDDLREGADVASYPRFRLINDYVDPGAELAQIYVAANVRHPKVQGAELQLRPDLNDLTRPYLMFTLGWNVVRPAQLARLNREGMSLFLRRNPGGRPAIDADAEWYFDKADEYVVEFNGKTPTKAKFVQFTGRPESTMRGHLTKCELWPWEIFRDVAFPRRCGASV